MGVRFDVGGRPARFVWNAVTGKAELVLDDERITVQSPAHVSTHFSTSTGRTGRETVIGHDVEVLKVRPRVLGGFRPNTFQISVDRAVVAKAKGR